MSIERVTNIRDILKESGMTSVRRLRETQSTDDFPLLFADVIERQILRGYQMVDATWEDYIHVTTVPDFRNVSRRRITGLEGTLSRVEELAGYPVGSVDEEEFVYSVLKYGNTFGISWEAIVNDDMNALRDTPLRFGRSARRTEYRMATQLFADPALRGAGEFFENGRNAIIAGGANLDPDNLATLYTMMKRTVDTDGEPIFNQPKYLVVGPALELTARNILSSTIIREILDANDEVEGERVNYWGQILELRVNHYMPFIDETATSDTSWYLFADPADIRAIEVGRLRGHEQPDLFMKAPDATPIGAGAADAWAGSFENDDLRFKVRHVIGGTQIDWRGAFMSDGV